MPSAAEIEAYIAASEDMNAAACALTLGAFLDAILERAIAANFYLHDDEHYDQLFTRDGSPLGSTSAKITVGAALMILNPAQRKACNLVRQIRNAFAHAAMPLDFSHPIIAKECAKLDPQNLTEDVYEPEQDTARERFQVSVLMLGSHLIRYVQEIMRVRALERESAIGESS